MYILLFLLIFLFMMVYAVFDKLSVLAFQIDTSRNDMHLIIYWLYPLFMAKVEMLDYSPHLNIYVFKIRVYSKTMQRKRKQNQGLTEMFQLLALQDSYAKLYYGLNTPFNTAIAGGIIGLLNVFINNISVFQYPDFIPGDEYFVIQAGSKLNVGKTIVRFVRMKYFHNKMKRSDKYGSVQYG